MDERRCRVCGKRLLLYCFRWCCEGPIYRVALEAAGPGRVESGERSGAKRRMSDGTGWVANLLPKRWKPPGPFGGSGT